MTFVFYEFRQQTWKGCILKSCLSSCVAHWDWWRCIVSQVQLKPVCQFRQQYLSFKTHVYLYSIYQKLSMNYGVRRTFCLYINYDYKLLPRMPSRHAASAISYFVHTSHCYEWCMEWVKTWSAVLRRLLITNCMLHNLATLCDVTYFYHWRTSDLPHWISGYFNYCTPPKIHKLLKPILLSN